VPGWKSAVPEGLKIDVGCGYSKRDGFIGVDKDPVPGVEHRVDVEREPLPFADRSVGTIFTSHCLEHLADQALIFHEMSRVATSGAALEIWTPYAWTDEAFIYTHRTFFTELHYLHPCVMFRDHWKDILGATWQLREFQFVVNETVQADLARNGVSLDFALKYLKGVAVEFGTHITIWHDEAPAPGQPLRTFSTTRDGPRRPIEPDEQQRRPPVVQASARGVSAWLRRLAPRRRSD
jgi:SAM-dependent methyltransferase